MAKKTVIKQLCNELDQTPELKEALAFDQIVLGKEGQQDTYADNPNNTDLFETEVEEKQTTITNSILPDEETGEVVEEVEQETLL